MKRRKIVQGLIWCLVVLVFVGCVWFLITNPYWILESKKERLLPDELILVKTEAEDRVFLGDAIDYRIKIIYNFQKIEIDKTSFYSVNFDPFEIRDQREYEFPLDNQTGIFLREYKIQLVEGAAGQKYEFPSIVVRYREKGTKDWLEKIVILQPISVSTRFPQGVSGYQLKPLKGKVIDLSLPIICGMFFGGGILGTLGLLKIIWRKRIKRKKKQIAKIKDPLLEACSSLKRQLELGEDSKVVARQIFPVLMMALAKKEKIDWLRPGLPRLPGEIEDKVRNLLKRCNESYRPEGCTREETEKMISDLKEIIEFYQRRG